MKETKINIGTIAMILFVIFSIIFIIQITLKILGRSPTHIQILYMVIVALVSYLFVMSYKLGQFVGEVKEFMKVSKSSFKKIYSETSSIKGKIDTINGRINTMDSRINIMNDKIDHLKGA